MKRVSTVDLPRSAKHNMWLATGLLVMAATGCGSNTPAVSSSASNGVDSLPCQDIGATATPPSDFSILFNRVALPTRSALQANRSGESIPTRRFFAKSGLFVRPGAAFDLVVPDEWRGRLTLGWGGKKGTHLQGPKCQPSNHANDFWLGYAGGYRGPQPSFVSGSLRGGRGEHAVRVV